MLLRIFPENPDYKNMQRALNVLRDGGIIIYPTDTVYGMGCDLNNAKAVQKIYRLKGLNPKKDFLSFINHDISNLSQYAKIDNQAFRLMKRNLPGPFTFILPATNQVPSHFRNKRRTVGIRIPDNPIARLLVRELGRPIISTSLHLEDHILEYPTDPELIYDDYKKIADGIIDGGAGDNQASTVVDLTGDTPEILRNGKGDLIL